MKYKKQIIVSFLILTLIALLAGCAAAPPTGETEAAPPAPPVEAESPPEEEEAGPPPAEPDPVPEGTVLTIYGDGVDGQTNWTLEELQAMEDGYREEVFSTTNNWPSFSHMTGHGISMRYLLEQAGIRDNAALMIFIAPDGYQAHITKGQIYETRYAFATHSAEQSGDPVEVEPIIAWALGEDEAVPENLRPMFGQLGPYDVNTAASVKNLYRIEVSTWDPGSWPKPEASEPAGSTVAAGTPLELTHTSMDNIKLYYTTDGSDPDYFSEVYNRSSSYFQPELIVPFTISESVTIKVFAGGLGKADSETVMLSYEVN